jgi:LuxR family transcriptional regulator, maltose regulon positive regulatory protein
MIDARLTAYRLHPERGNDVAAARMAIALALLDEAAAAALAGDISDPYAAGLTCCYLISACDRVRDYDRAAQWCAPLREFSTRQRYAVLMTTCRLQYGSVLISRGEWAEADAELQAAKSSAWSPKA